MLCEFKEKNAVTLDAAKTLTLAAVLMLAGCDQSDHQTRAGAAEAKKPVYTVDSVTLERPGAMPAALVVKASGTVRSSGWSKPELQPDKQPGSAGMIVYDFVALSPPKDTNAVEAEQPIDASLRIDYLPPAVKIIRVVAETNQTDAAVATNDAPTAPPDQSQPQQ